MKESLKKLPFVGWGMSLSKFIFLKRNWEQDKAGLANHLQSLSKADEPMWLMFFPEGTNLAPSTREKSKNWADKNGIKDFQHVLLPRSTGLHFCLLKLRETVDYVYDCTIAYEGVPYVKPTFLIIIAALTVVGEVSMHRIYSLSNQLGSAVSLPSP